MNDFQSYGVSISTAVITCAGVYLSREVAKIGIDKWDDNQENIENMLSLDAEKWIKIIAMGVGGYISLTQGIKLTTKIFTGKSVTFGEIMAPNVKNLVSVIQGLLVRLGILIKTESSMNPYLFNSEKFQNIPYMEASLRWLGLLQPLNLTCGPRPI